MSETTAETATTETTEQTKETAETAGPDFSTLADLGLTPEQITQKLEHARTWETRAKDNKAAADELERIKREALPEQERLVAEAEARGTANATAKLAGRLVDAEIKAAATGRSVDVDALLEGLDRTRFLTDDGEPNTAAISAWIDRLAPVTDTSAASVVDLGQGARPNAQMALGSDPLLALLKNTVGAK